MGQTEVGLPQPDVGQDRTGLSLHWEPQAGVGGTRGWPDVQPEMCLIRGIVGDCRRRGREAGEGGKTGKAGVWDLQGR